MTRLMQLNTKYIKIYSRDFTLPWLQIWYKGEAKTPKIWNKQINKSFPYIVYVRNNDTIECYFDPQGLHWSRQNVLMEIRRDKNIQNIIIENVKNVIKPIKILLKKKVLNKEELLQYFELFQKAYPWLLAMWDATSDDKEIGTLDVSVIRNFRVTINTFNDDLDNVIIKSLQEIFPHLANYVHVLSIQEIGSGITPSLSVLKTRNNGFIYTDEKLFNINQLENIEKKYNIKLEQNKIIPKTTVVKGNIASKGYAKGYVRQVLGYKHMKNFQQGEILVSSMTMPDFIPAMKKAAAIVTDEGGITCHAAIIARELKKPCIVGTSIATSVFKNGDLVEVDAIKGIVRKI